MEKVEVVPKSSSKAAVDKTVDVSSHLPDRKSQSDSDLDSKPTDNKILDKTLDPVIEVNEKISEVFEKPYEREDFIEISPRIFAQKEVQGGLTIESLNNAIYENGVVNMCWPEITEPVFENRTCFPPSYYTNNTKEKLLLAYAESFRRQYNMHYRHLARKPLLLQAPNECGLQKMVCTSIRQTRLCYAGTNTWQGLASLVADYFEYEPLTKPMLHVLIPPCEEEVHCQHLQPSATTSSDQPIIGPRLPERILSPYTTIVRRSGNPFEIAHVLVSWLIGSSYDAYVVVGCAKRDTCMNIRYRTICPDIPDETPVVEEVEEPEEEPRYKLVLLPDFTSKYVKMMEDRAAKKIQDEIDKQEAERAAKIAELEKPPPDPIDGWRTHAWVLILAGPGVDAPFFVEPSEGNAYPLSASQYQYIESLYNNENYYVNIQDPIEIAWKIAEEEAEEEEFPECKTEEERQEFLRIRKERIKEFERMKKEAEAKKREEEEKAKEVEEYKKAKKEQEEEERREVLGLKKKRKKKKKLDEEEKAEEEEEEEEKERPPPDLSKYSYELNDLSCWEHLLAGEPASRRQLVGVDTSDKRTAVETEKHLDMPWSWVEKLDITAAEFEQRYPGFYKVIHYKKVLLEKFSRYSQKDGIVKRIKIFEDYALTSPLLTYEYYMNRDDKMDAVRIDHAKGEVQESFLTGRPDYLIKHTYAISSNPHSIEAYRTLEFNWYSRVDHLVKIVCTPLTFNEYYTNRADRLETRFVVYLEGTKAEPKRRLKDITETYSRNPDVPANIDVWKRIFHIEDDSIELQYHYGYNFVTNDNRSYIKPNLAETGGEILFYEDKTSGYIADPCGKVPRPLTIYYGLCDNIAWEYGTTKHIRDMESDVNGYLRQRHKEITEPMLYISLFNTERNLDAQRGYREQELKKAEREEREKELYIDPLAPYLARMFGSGHGAGQPLTVKEANLVREQCINDFRAKQLARQILVQERFDKLNTEYKNKRLWYLANQFILTPEKETAYFAMSAELAFQVHTLEVRLTRHRDLSAPRFKALMELLDKHPLLVEINKMRHRK